MKVHVIGSGWAVPQENKSKTSILLRDEHNILFDCGGDVAKAFSFFGLDENELDAVFISHKHLDHLSGLSSLLHCLWLSDREKKLPIYSNQETLNLLNELIKLHDLDTKLDLEMNLLRDKGKVNEFGVKHCLVEHQVETTAFRYKDVSFSGDTKPCGSFIDLAQDSDLLIHEATYPSGKEKEAHEYGHSSIKDALEVKNKTNSNNLAIIHTSPIVDATKEIKGIDDNILLPQDYTTIQIEDN